MGISNEVRKTGAMELIPRAPERASALFPLQKKKIILAVTAMLLLTVGTVWAKPRGQWRGGGMQSSAAWGQRGGARFGGQRMGGPQQRQEHLPQWFRQHQNLSPQAQERALHNEPGFNRLPPAEQQRLSNRLRQLDLMPPLQRERTLQRMEALERLSPEQREQVRSAMQQVTMMPQARQRVMHKAFQDLSQMTPRERWAILNSARFRAQFSNWERQTLSTLLSVQPYAAAPWGPGQAYGGR